MKALFCGSCGDIQGLEIVERSCHCGAVVARWIDPQRGTCVFAERKQKTAWLLGIHNHLLQGAFENPPRKPSPLEYAAWENAQGYVFKNVRSMIARVRPGETSDSWLVPIGEIRDFRPPEG